MANSTVLVLHIGCTKSFMNNRWKWSPANDKRALRRLGVAHYRPGQGEIVETVMRGGDGLGILPTAAVNHFAISCRLCCSNARS